MKDPKEYTVEQSGPATVEEFLLLADKVRTKTQSIKTHDDHRFKEGDPYQFESFKKWLTANKERYQKEDLMPVLKATDVKDPLFIQEGVVTWSVGEFKNYRRAWRYVNGIWHNLFNDISQFGSNRPEEGVSEIQPILSNHGLKKDGFDPNRLFSIEEGRWVTRTGKRLLWNGINNTLNESNGTDLLTYDSYSVFSYQDVGTSNAQSHIRARYTNQQMLEKAIKTDPKVFHMQYFNIAPVVMEAEGKSAYYMFPYFMHLFPMGTPESAIEAFFETEVYTGQGEEKYSSFYKKYPPSVEGIRKLWEDTKPGGAFHKAAKNCYLRAMAKQLNASHGIPEADFLRDFGGEHDGIGRFFNMGNRKRHADECFDFHQLKWFMLIHGKILGNKGTTWTAFRDKYHPFYHPIVEKWTSVVKGSLDLTNDFQKIFHDDATNGIMMSLVYFNNYCHAMARDRGNDKLVSGYYFGETTLYPLHRLINSTDSQRSILVNSFVELNREHWVRWKEGSLYGRLVKHFENIDSESKTVLGLTADNIYYALKLARALRAQILTSPDEISTIAMDGSWFDIDILTTTAAGVYDRALFTEDNPYRSCGYFKKTSPKGVDWEMLSRRSWFTAFGIVRGSITSLNITRNRKLITILPESDEWKNPFKFSTALTAADRSGSDEEGYYALTYQGYGFGDYNYATPFTLEFINEPGRTVSWINQQATMDSFRMGAGRQRNAVLTTAWSLANFLGFIKKNNEKYQCPFVTTYGYILSHFVTYNTIMPSTGNGVNKDPCITTIRHGLPWLMIQSRMNGIDIPSRKVMMDIIDTLPPYRKYVDIVKYFKHNFSFTPDGEFLKEAVKDARMLLAQLEPLRNKNPADTNQNTYPHRMKSVREVEKPTFPSHAGKTTNKVGMVSHEAFVYRGTYARRVDREDSPYLHMETTTGLVSAPPLYYEYYWPATLFNKTEIAKFYHDFRYMGLKMPRLKQTALFNDSLASTWIANEETTSLLNGLRQNYAYDTADDEVLGRLRRDDAVIVSDGSLTSGLMFSLSSAGNYRFNDFSIRAPYYDYNYGMRSSDSMFFNLGFGQWHYNLGCYQQSEGFGERMSNDILTNNVLLSRTTRGLLGRWGHLWSDSIPLAIQPLRHIDTVLKLMKITATQQNGRDATWEDIVQLIGYLKTGFVNNQTPEAGLLGGVMQPMAADETGGVMFGKTRADTGEDYFGEPVDWNRYTKSYEFTTACLLLRKYGRLPMYHPHYHRDIHIERTLIDMAILSLRQGLGREWIELVGDDTRIDMPSYTNEFLTRYDLYSGTIPPYTRLMNEGGWVTLLSQWGLSWFKDGNSTFNNDVLGLNAQGQPMKTTLSAVNLETDTIADSIAESVKPVNSDSLSALLKKPVSGAKYGLFHYRSQFGSGGIVNDIYLVHVAVLKDEDCDNANWSHLRSLPDNHPVAKTRFFKEAYEAGKWTVFDRDSYENPFSIINTPLPSNGNKDIPNGIVPVYIMPWALLDNNGEIKAFLCTDDPIQYYQSLDIEMIEKANRIQEYHNGKPVKDPASYWSIETNRVKWY